jgi:hypothetical protein
MELIVCGGRGYCDLETVYKTLDHINTETPITLLITGGCSGADQLAELWANERGVTLKVVPAQWDIYGRGAGPLRNKEMAEMNPDMVVAFKGGRGTQNMCKIARDRGIPVKEVD